MRKTIRVLIADDHAVVRKGLRALIQSEPGMELMAEATGCGDVVQKSLRLQPDVILLDLVMPDSDGIEVIREIRQVSPQARILILSSFGEDDKTFAAIQAGAIGYLLKDAPPGELLNTIRNIYYGG